MKDKIIITGITGMDGSNLADLLVGKGYDVYGVVRRASTINTSRIDHLIFPKEKATLVYGDLADGIDDLIYDLKPAYLFNTAAMSHVRVSFDMPKYTLDINAIGPTRILEGIRKISPKTRFLQCSSSEMYGMSPPPQNENTPFRPCSPYGCAKLAAYWMTKLYRDGYGLFSSNSICFNHEGPRRGETFVTKKIVRAAVRIKLGKQKDLILGNLGAKRDWGDSRCYVRAMLKILQHDEPGDFVVATGEHYSVKEFLIKVFERLDLDWGKYVKHDEKYIRPKEVPALMGDPSKIKKVLNWEPQIRIDQLISEMIGAVMEEEIK